MTRMVMVTCIVLTLTGQASAAWLSCTTQSVVRLNDDGTDSLTGWLLMRFRYIQKVEEANQNRH